MMMYTNTRDKDEKVSASQAILNGLANKGGLYVPCELPKIDIAKKSFLEQTYQELAYGVMQPLLSDFSEEELKECIQNAYNDKFTDKKIAPINKQGNDIYLELFHGPTLAFKDMALSVLPYLMTTALKKQGIEKEIVILTATSGDTGKAAMEGFSDVIGTQIIVFYPKNGVSEIQEKQMLTQKGNNTFVVGIDGNFDDAQTSVKQMFEDELLRKELANKNKQFSSANSINIGRLIPQIVYYFYGYQQMVNSGVISMGKKINVSVPTGNFGNILAAHYAKKMGLPINKLICSSNKNNVLTDFFKTGCYSRNREFFVTNSPSMDILISSNLERLLFEAVQKNQERLVELMNNLKQVGDYQLTKQEKETLSGIYAGFTDELAIETVVKQVFRESNYVLDPHTAVAKNVADEFRENEGDELEILIISTANPYKFPEVFTGKTPKGEEINQFHQKSNMKIPLAITELDQLPIRQKDYIKTSEMKQKVRDLLKI